MISIANNNKRLGRTKEETEQESMFVEPVAQIIDNNNNNNNLGFEVQRERDMRARPSLVHLVCLFDCLLYGHPRPVRIISVFVTSSSSI